MSSEAATPKRRSNGACPGCQSSTNATTCSGTPLRSITYSCAGASPARTRNWRRLPSRPISLMVDRSVSSDTLATGSGNHGTGCSRRGWASGWCGPNSEEGTTAPPASTTTTSASSGDHACWYTSSCRVARYAPWSDACKASGHCRAKSSEGAASASTGRASHDISAGRVEAGFLMRYVPRWRRAAVPVQGNPPPCTAGRRL